MADISDGLYQRLVSRGLAEALSLLETSDLHEEVIDDDRLEGALERYLTRIVREALRVADTKQQLDFAR